MAAGAWGLGLFQSDYDYDILQELSYELGTCELEERDARVLKQTPVYELAFRAAAAGRLNGQAIRQIEHSRADNYKIKRGNKEIYYSVYAGLCSHPERVKQCLGLECQKLAAKKMAEAQEADRKGTKTPAGKPRPHYVVVLLGAAMMSTGFELTEDFFKYLRSIYTDFNKVGLMRDAMTQMEKALFGPDGYTFGVPYDFGSKGMHAGDFPAVRDTYVPLTTNVPSPSGLIPDEIFDVVGIKWYKDESDKPRARRAMKLLLKRSRGKGGMEEPLESCGACGAEARVEGGKERLLRCGKCDLQTYCSRACQVKHLEEHKKSCGKEEEKEGGRDKSEVTETTNVEIKDDMGKTDDKKKKENKSQKKKAVVAEEQVGSDEKTSTKPALKLVGGRFVRVIKDPTELLEEGVAELVVKEAGI